MTDERDERDENGAPGEAENEPSGDRFADRFDDEEDARRAPGEDPVEPYDVLEQPEAADRSDRAAGPGSGEDAEPEPFKEPKKKGDRQSVHERIDRWRRGAAGEGEALSRAGVLGWKFYVILGVGALIAAIVLAVTNTTYAADANFWQKLGPGSRETLRVLLRAPIHLSIGMLAFALTAWAVGVRAGRGDLAAARIGLAVSLAIMALEMRWGFPGQRMVVYLVAFALYFAAVLLSFRCPPRVAGTLIALHAGIFAAIAGLGWMIVWVGL